MIKVVVAEPNKKPEIREIPNTLQAMQGLVGGYIESVTISPFLTVICNEEGRFEGLPYNRHVTNIEFVGTIFGTAYNKEGEFVSLNQEQIDYLTYVFEKGKNY